MKYITLSILLLSSITFAFECSKKIKWGFDRREINLSIKASRKENQATIRFGNNEKTVYLDQNTWDGHSTGLITGESFALKHESHYGCIRNVTVISKLPEVSNLLEFKFKGCKGGTTSDDLCFQ